MPKSIPTGFRLNSSEVVSSNLSVGTQKVMRVARDLPADELYTMRQMAHACGYTKTHFEDIGRDPALAAFRRVVKHQGRNIVVWGNERTIQKLDKETE